MNLYECVYSRGSGSFYDEVVYIIQSDSFENATLISNEISKEHEYDSHWRISISLIEFYKNYTEISCRWS